MFRNVNYQEQWKQRKSDCIHSGVIPKTSRRRREFRRTEKTDIGLCPIQGVPLCSYASTSVPLWSPVPHWAPVVHEMNVGSFSSSWVKRIRYEKYEFSSWKKSGGVSKTVMMPSVTVPTRRWRTNHLHHCVIRPSYRCFQMRLRPLGLQFYT